MAGVLAPIREGGKIDPHPGVHGSHVAGDGTEDSMPARGVIADGLAPVPPVCEQTLTAQTVICREKTGILGTIEIERIERLKARGIVMFKVAVIEDDLPTSNQLKAWILSARPEIAVDQWFTRDDAEAAIAREAYDLVVLDIELGRERHAGVAIINAINKGRQGTPVLVVSAMPATIYRSIMKALDAWDYLQKTTFEESDFIDTFLEILRASRDRDANKPVVAAGDELSLDPLRQSLSLIHI